MLLIISLAVLSATAIALVTRIVASRLRQSDRQRRRRAGMFRFYDGKHIRAVDPIAVLMALEAHPSFRLDLDPVRAIRDGDLEATQRLAEAVSEAFDVPPFSDPAKPGLTVQERVELLCVFLDYLDLQKKSTSGTQTPQQSTGATSSESDRQTTRDTSDTGSTATAPELARPSQ